MEEEIKKKNVLDLQFQKYLMITSTSIIVAFTYLVGIGIAIFSKQIKLDDLVNIGAIFVISVAILGICAMAFFNAVFHLKNIPKVLRDL